MRFTINKDQFLKSLLRAGHAISPKAVVPLMSNVMLNLSEKGLQITGTNDEMTIRCTVPYMIGEIEIIRGAGMGSTLINAHLLTEVVRKMDGNDVTVEIVDNAIAKIDDGRSSFKLNCARAEEYPDIDLELNGQILDLRCHDFALLVEQSAFAASGKGNQRPVLSAVNLEANGAGVLTATATDSARLAQKQLHVDSDVKFNVNVKAKILAEVARLFELTEMVRIAVSDNKILFDFDNAVVSTRLIADPYPVPKTIFQQTYNYSLEVNAQELADAIERVSILSADKDFAVKLSMREDLVEVHSRSETNGSANEAVQTFSFNGSRLEVSFNPLFVLDAIKALRSEDVVFCFQAEMRPFVVKNPKDDSVIELITPMRTY
mgnify:FL=1